MSNTEQRCLYIYIENEEFYQKIVRYCKEQDISRSEFGNRVFLDFLENKEKEWQVLFKAQNRLLHRIERTETEIKTQTELMLAVVQVLFMAIPKNYAPEELAEIDSRTEKSMRIFIETLKKNLLEGGLYSPELKDIHIEER
jgi:hypothetical protein